MGMDATDLQKFRDAQAGTRTENGIKTENVVKMFNDPAKIAAIKATVETVTIGNPPVMVVIKPLNPKNGIEAYKILRTTLFPIINLYRQTSKPTLGDVLAAFGDNIDDLPKLIHIIIARGNPQLTLEWVEENVDLIPDFLTLLDPFMRQNMLDQMFSPKAPAPPQVSSQNGADSSEPAKMETISTAE